MATDPQDQAPRWSAAVRSCILRSQAGADPRGLSAHFLGLLRQMIDRRTFVISTGVTVLVLVLPKSSLATERQVRIITYVPRRVFFSTDSADAQVFLSSLDLTNEGRTVSGSFSNGHAMEFVSDISSQYVLQESEGQRATRRSVMYRSLAAWVIDAVWHSIRNKRSPTTSGQLRDNFESFQTQAILEAVTPASLYHLVRDTLLKKQITSVAWNKATLRFEVI